MVEPDATVYKPFPAFVEWADLEVDTDQFDSFVAALENSRAESTPDDLRAAVDTATRWAAVDTGAIEGLYQVDRGFTMSVAAEAIAWEAMAIEVGESAAQSIRDSFEAYESVLDLATGGRGPVTEALIRQLHELLCRSQETYRVHTSAGVQEQSLPRGIYKEHPNNPVNLRRGEIHAYASPLETPSEMARLVAELGSPTFSGAHPVLQAAYAHYAFVCVHPFADGNGRVARALASVYLYRRPGIPLVIFADQKDRYIDALEAADAGNMRPWAAFVLDRAIDTIQMVRAGLGVERVSVADRLARLRPLLVGREGRTHSEIDLIASRLWSALMEHFAALTSAHDLPEGVSASIDEVPHGRRPPHGYRDVPGLRSLSLKVEADAPARATVQGVFEVAVSRPDQSTPDVIIYRGSEVVVEAFLRELDPEVTRPLDYRLSVAAEREYVRLIDAVSIEIDKVLTQRGYR